MQRIRLNKSIPRPAIDWKARGGRVRELRVFAVTQAQHARELRISQGQLSRYEQGRGEIGAEILLRFARRSGRSEPTRMAAEFWAAFLLHQMKGGSTVTVAIGRLHSRLAGKASKETDSEKLMRILEALCRALNEVVWLSLLSSPLRLHPHASWQ